MRKPVNRWPLPVVSIVFTIQSSDLIETEQSQQTAGLSCTQKTDCKFPSSLYYENHYCSGYFRDVREGHLECKT